MNAVSVPAEHRARITGVEEVAQEMFLLRLHAPELAASARPGQFVMARATDSPGGSYLPYLHRPLALHGIRPSEGEVSLLFQVIGIGTRSLSLARSDRHLDVLGPLGKPVALPEDARHIVFVAGGLGIASLTALIDEALGRGSRVTLLAGARTAWRMYPSRLLPDGVREMTATDDGSAGVRAPVTHLLQQVQHETDLVVACGPTPMLAALARMRADGLLAAPTILLLESRMACGFGICHSCVVATYDGSKLICVDGPAFNLDEVDWDAQAAEGG